MHTYTYMYTHMHTSKYNLLKLYTVTCMYMFSGPTIRYWVTNWCVLLRRRLVSHYQHLLIACSSFCRFEASWPYPKARFCSEFSKQ